MEIIHPCFPSCFDDQHPDPPLLGAWTRPERFVSPAVVLEKTPGATKSMLDETENDHCAVGLMRNDGIHPI